MKKHIVKIITALAVVIGGVALAPSAYAGDSIEVESVSFAETSAKTEVNSVTRATINGATQLTWMNENHRVPITVKDLRRAPQIKVNKSMTSKQLYKKSHRAEYVIVFGEWKNWGMLGKRKVPTITKARYPGMVMHWNGHIYEHGWTLKRPGQVKQDDEVLMKTKLKIRGKRIKVAVVKSCLNDFGGRGKPVKAVFIRYKLDVLEDIEIEAAVDVTAKVKASLECPTGTLEAEASAAASASATASIRVKVRGKLAAVNATKLALLAKVRADAKVKAEAEAVAKIKLTCSDNPQPPDEPEKPTITVSPGACVDEGEQDGIVTVVVGNPNDEDDTATVSVGSKTQTVAVSAGSTATLTFTGFGPGTYGVSAMLQKAGKSASTTVTVNKCDTPEPPQDNPPSMQCQGPQHIFVGDDAMFADFDLTDPDGDPVSFGAPQVSGPLQVVLVEDAPVAGGKRRTVGIRAADIPEGTSQNATLTVSGTAGGKSVSCTVNVIVENAKTGW